MAIFLFKCPKCNNAKDVSLFAHTETNILDIITECDRCRIPMNKITPEEEKKLKDGIK